MSAANRAAKEIAVLASRILVLAPIAGLHVGIKIKPALKARGEA